MSELARTAPSSADAGVGRWLARITSRAALPCSFRIHTSSGVTDVGQGTPEFDLHVHNDSGMRALASLDELRIADAYVRGDLDLEGDVVKAMWLRGALSDRNLWLKLWRRLQPLLFGRERLNPDWIAKHYDSQNIQFFATDDDYHAYTPGIYVTEDDTLEESSRRKYEFAWNSLRLRPGMELLEVGCGWGGMTRFCARKGVRVTAITLSRDQLGYTAEAIAAEHLDATVEYQDFFTLPAGRRFDAISCMGVLEDLSDYGRVMRRFTELLAPGGRAYLDFAAGKVPFGTSSFVTKHVWPGTFRMVYMPHLMEAIDRSEMELEAIYNDRKNYALWTRNGHARWVANKDAVIARAGVETWRLFRLLFMGTAGVMSDPSHQVTAYRMVLQRRRNDPRARPSGPHAAS